MERRRGRRRRRYLEEKGTQAQLYFLYLKEMNGYISLLESVYLLYMFHFFETSVDFSIAESPSGWWFRHTVGNEKGLRICPFGRIAILAYIFIILARGPLDFPSWVSRAALVLAMFLALMNMNAVVYLLPVAAVEWCGW